MYNRLFPHSPSNRPYRRETAHVNRVVETFNTFGVLENNDCGEDVSMIHTSTMCQTKMPEPTLCTTTTKKQSRRISVTDDFIADVSETHQLIQVGGLTQDS